MSKVNETDGGGSNGRLRYKMSFQGRPVREEVFNTAKNRLF